MRRLVTVVAVALLAFTVPGHAGPGENGVTSDDVEHVAFVPFEVGTATGANIVGKFLYVTSWKSFSIYDISDPLNPVRLSTTPFGFEFENENVSTNGKIMLFAEQVPVDRLHVWDVEDKSNPSEIGTLIGGGTHTATCILDCAYSYGTYDFAGPEGASTGALLVDLRDPAAPKELGHWNADLPADKIHDVTELEPGRVITASQPIMYLDARSDPLKPKLLAVGTNDDRRMHSVVWPRRGRDRFLVSSFETNGSVRCDDASGELTIWDASKWRKTHTFTPVEEFRVSSGTYSDGSPAVNQLGCSAHWFQEHPTWHDGGLLAAGFYEHGTRFLRVDATGHVEEVGYFMPWAGSTSAAYWVTDRIVYAVDYTRGIDILRFKGDI